MPAFRPYRLVALAVLMSAVVLSGCGNAESSRASHMSRGQKYFDAGNFDKARVEFHNALQIAPNDVAARFMSGQVAEKLGNVREAAGMYQGVIEVDPNHVGARANLGRVFVFAGEPDRALSTIEPALSKHPDDADLLSVRGAARAQLKDMPDALADAQRAVKLAPTNEGSVGLLASLYHQAGQTPQAIELLNNTLKSIPRSVDLRQVLATMYGLAGQGPLAEEQLRKIMEIRPKDLAPRYRLALYYAGSKRLDDAERVLKDAVAALPDSDEAKMSYVQFLASRRSNADAERVLRQYIAQNPKAYNLQLDLADLQQRSGAVQDAIATYNAVIAKDSDGPRGLSARDRIAAIYLGQGHADEAVKLIAQVLKESPRDNDALTLRGNIALERGDASAAIADFRAVLRDQPGLVVVSRTLARAYLVNNEPALAEETLRGAMDSAASDPQVRIDLAQLLAQTHQIDKAVQLLEDSVRAAPKNVSLREALVRAYIAKPDLGAARTAAEDLKTLRPDLATGFYLSGVIAQAQNRLDDARKDLDKALELQPSAVDVVAALARLETGRGDVDAAIRDVRAAISRDGRSAITHNLLGELQLAKKSYGDATAELQQAMTLSPQWALPYRNLALVRAATHDDAGAVEAYEQGLKATGFEPSLSAELARIYEHRGSVDKAIGVYEALQQHHPKLDLAANNLAMLLVTYRKDQPSLDRARDLTAAFAKSDSGALLDTNGWVRLKRGEIAEALPVLEKAAARDPQSRVIRYHLAMAELKSGRSDKARSDLESALGGGKSFEGIDEARTVLAELKAKGSAS